MNTHLSRRQFLRGAGALLSLPFLESLQRTSAFGASTDAKPPLRMGIFTVTGGTVLESWKMPQGGAFTGKLPSILQPLEFCKDDLLLLTGLAQSGSSENVNAHEHCAFTHLTGASKVRREGGKPQAAISVDQVAARTVGKDTLLASLELGLAGRENVYSFRGADEPIPYEADPRLVFERMFRGRKPVVPNWARRAANLAAATQASARSDSYERSVIDLVMDDARSLQRRLGRADQQKLDEYLTSVRSVEQRIAFVEARKQLDLIDETNPGPSKLNLPPQLQPDGTWLWKDNHQVHQDPERHAEYIRLMSDLMILAFQTDTTRVCTFAAGSDEAMFPGVVTVGYERHCHTLEHQGNAGRVEDADPISREACRQIHAWYTALFAELVRKMKSIDEGGSTLLDNTMLLYTSYMADGGHGREDYPALLVGKAGGSLRTGRQLDFQEKTPAANLYNELLDRMGAPAGDFGDSLTSKYAAYNGRLPELA